MAVRTTTAVTAISKIRDRPVNRAAALVVIYGDELGKKYDLTGKTTVIGRSSRATIQVDQDSVSRNHARISNERGHLTIEDLGSTNGTFVNDEEVEGHLKLRNGDFVKIGRTIFKYIAGNNIEAAYHDEVYKLTTMDGLTQVFNRRYFVDVLERELARCRRHNRALSLVLIDVDHFKKINDKHGHLAGDHVLREVASLIRSRIRREDILARYGGEEFGVLVPEVDLKGATTMAEKTRKLVEKHKFSFDDVVIPVTISAGVASISKKIDDGEALIRRSDEQLYAAKESGRNQVCS